MPVWEQSSLDEIQLLRETHDSLPSAVISVDPDGVVVYVNETSRRMVPAITVGSNLRATLEEMTNVEKVDRLLIRRELVTFRGTPGGPELHWVAWDKGKGLLVLTVWETDWSEAMNEQRAEFTMAVSHELRGPMTALRGFSEILNMDTSNLTPEQAEAAAVIEATARHLTVLAEDVFDLSRNSFGELRLNLQKTDLAELLESVVSTLRGTVENRGQTLTCEITGELPEIMADEARATQMVSNLINNASIHNPEQTTVEVSAKLVDGGIAVSVKDDGEGLPFDDPNEAFRSFSRGEGATAGDRTGSGIGLALTKRLIELHRGRILVESAPGEGSLFVLLFPLDRDAALEPGDRQASEPGLVL